MHKQYKADLALLGVTLSWGVSFIFTKDILSTLSTFNFLSIRFLIAAFFAALIYFKRIIRIDKNTLKYGTFIGLILFSAYAIQTIGLYYTTPSKSAFITGFSVVIVPILSSLLLKKMPRFSSVIGVIAAIVGLAFLTLDSQLTLSKGDLCTFICAFFFAFHILMVGRYAMQVDAINLAIIQIGVVGILSTMVTIIFESPIIPHGKNLWLCMLTLSLICTSGGVIIQNTMQKYTSATHTALIFTSEPMFAAIFSYFLIGERLNTRGIIGSILIILGMLIAEFNLSIPFLKSKTTSQSHSL
jgi:drug/metabolite transporter (DMT)-like permease